MSSTSHNSPMSFQWTWADQLSTYRFWGLAGFYVSVVTSRLFFTLISSRHFQNVIGLGDSDIVLLMRLTALSTLFGFWVAWVAVQWRTKLVLLGMASLEVVGFLLLARAEQVPVVWCGSVLVGLASGAVLVAVPAILAGGRGGSEAFVVAFGLVFTFDALMRTVGPLCISWVVELVVELSGTTRLAFALPVGLAGLGLLFLVPVRPALFNEPPPARGASLEPQERSPFVVALLCFVPVFGVIYMLYWIYRVHGEVAWLSPGRGILSPLAALLVFLFVPLMPVLVLTTLVLELNRRGAERSARAYASPVAVFVLALFFWPIAMAIIQAAMNTATKELTALQDES